MNALKKVGLFVLDFIEIFMPVVALTVTFGAFIVNVISRYVMHSPVNACYELCLMGLVWCLLLSAPYAVRKNNNVAFTLLYDHQGELGQLIFRLVGNGFLIFCLAAMLYPCYDWVAFMFRKFTTVLKIRMDIVYAPFVVFNVLTLGHLLYFFIQDVILAVRAATGKVTLKSKKEKEGGAEA